MIGQIIEALGLAVLRMLQIAFGEEAHLCRAEPAIRRSARIAGGIALYNVFVGLAAHELL
jgi:hypothetical protein